MFTLILWGPAVRLNGSLATVRTTCARYFGAVTLSPAWMTGRINGRMVRYRDVLACGVVVGVLVAA
jgi:hypothetical protein